MTSTLRDVRSSDWPDAGHPPRLAALLLHGYGSNERDLTGLVPGLELTMPWASLGAPIDLGNGGSAWFSITTPGDPDPEPLAEATDAIWAWVDENLGSSARVLPIGFSQGGLMASELLRSRPERVVAPVILGGFVQRTPQPGDEVLAATRPAAFWGRGGEDRMIGMPAIERTGRFLPAHSQLEERIYPGLGHGINADELADVRRFIAANIDAVDASAR